MDVCIFIIYVRILLLSLALNKKYELNLLHFCCCFIKYLSNLFAIYTINQKKKNLIIFYIFFLFFKILFPFFSANYSLEAKQATAVSNFENISILTVDALGSVCFVHMV